ncbi:MAG TPA: STN and carboxypeptidase regulatory-like domain-containing protein [Bacteroidales bacterium]|nr:STN and carboxypeptidase regulatory-like domain-containing protein [Bacteroidales bacterium]
MHSPNGRIIRFIAIALMFLFAEKQAMCQETILNSTFSFRSGTVKTGHALEIISKQTGYNFTYDSRLIDAERKVQLDYSNTPLRTVLSGIINNDSLVYSVIDRYIIISKPEKQTVYKSESTQGRPDAATGRIIDEETGDPLAFATIGFRSVPKGTVTNAGGEFVLNIPEGLLDDTLSVSFLGYIGRNIPVNQAIGNNMTITMRREYISIPEIIIRNQIPQEIILKARRAIPRNYGDTPVMMTGFYREGVLRKSELQTYSEAVLQIYKSPYTSTLLNDQIKVYKSRKMENVDRSDTLAVRLKAGLSTSLELDGARNLFDFISPEYLGDYNYRLSDIVTYDDESAYAIDFEQREGAETPLFRGTIFINTSDFGIYKAEFEISPSKISKIKESFITSSAGGFITWPVSVKYSVSYRKSDGRYFLSHVRGDLLFNSKQRKRLFNSQFNVFFELAITDTELKNVKRFEREDLAPVHSVFSKTITSYDPEFWGDQNFLRPEENLLQALKKMRVKLQEFSE